MWILIIIAFTSYGTVIDTSEFSDRSACEAARDWLRQVAHTSSQARCFPKGVRSEPHG